MRRLPPSPSSFPPRCGTRAASRCPPGSGSPRGAEPGSLRVVLAAGGRRSPGLLGPVPLGDAGVAAQVLGAGPGSGCWPRGCCLLRGRRLRCCGGVLVWKPHEEGICCARVPPARLLFLCQKAFALTAGPPLGCGGAAFAELAQGTSSLS